MNQKIMRTMMLFGLFNAVGGSFGMEGQSTPDFELVAITKDVVVRRADGFHFFRDGARPEVCAAILAGKKIKKNVDNEMGGYIYYPFQTDPAFQQLLVSVEPLPDKTQVGILLDSDLALKNINYNLPHYHNCTMSLSDISPLVITDNTRKISLVVPSSLKKMVKDLFCSEINKRPQDFGLIVKNKTTNELSSYEINKIFFESVPFKLMPIQGVDEGYENCTLDVNQHLVLTGYGRCAYVNNFDIAQIDKLCKTSTPFILQVTLDKERTNPVVLNMHITKVINGYHKCVLMGEVADLRVLTADNHDSLEAKTIEGRSYFSKKFFSCLGLSGILLYILYYTNAHRIFAH